MCRTHFVGSDFSGSNVCQCDNKIFIELNSNNKRGGVLLVYFVKRRDYDDDDDADDEDDEF